MSHCKKRLDNLRFLCNSFKFCTVRIDILPFYDTWSKLQYFQYVRTPSADLPHSPRVSWNLKRTLRSRFHWYVYMYFGTQYLRCMIEYWLDMTNTIKWLSNTSLNGGAPAASEGWPPAPLCDWLLRCTGVRSEQNWTVMWQVAGAEFKYQFPVPSTGYLVPTKPNKPD